MDLLIGAIIGAIYGRNARAINSQASHDIQRLFWALSKTGFAANTYYMLEGIYLAFERKFTHKSIYTHDILCTCNRRTCKPVSINTYVRKIKAIH